MVQEILKRYRFGSDHSLRCYCAFCRTERRHFRKRHITLVNIMWSILASTLAMIIIWQMVNARVLVIFVIFLAISEMFIQVRWRMSLPCPHCGFDPVLYLKEPEKASTRVKSHLERRYQDPMLLLSPNPILKIPVKKVKKDWRDQLKEDPSKFLGRPPTP